ncbi:hypothetical protein [Cupriavidus necator]
MKNAAARPDLQDIQRSLKVGDDISADDIMPAGAAVLPYRSNIIPAISEFVYEPIDKFYVTRAKAVGDHATVGGMNYGQDSSREHAAIAPRYLGLRMVIARGFARIHWQNLVNFGILPLTFEDAADYDRLAVGDVLVLEHIDMALAAGTEIETSIADRGERLLLTHRLSPRGRADQLAACAELSTAVLHPIRRTAGGPSSRFTPSTTGVASDRLEAQAPG